MVFVFFFFLTSNNQNERKNISGCQNIVFCLGSTFDPLWKSILHLIIIIQFFHYLFFIICLENNIWKSILHLIISIIFFNIVFFKEITKMQVHKLYLVGKMLFFIWKAIFLASPLINITYFYSILCISTSDIWKM